MLGGTNTNHYQMTCKQASLSLAVMSTPKGLGLDIISHVFTERIAPASCCFSNNHIYFF